MLIVRLGVYWTNVYVLNAEKHVIFLTLSIAAAPLFTLCFLARVSVRPHLLKIPLVSCHKPEQTPPNSLIHCLWIEPVYISLRSSVLILYTVFIQHIVLVYNLEKTEISISMKKIIIIMFGLPGCRLQCIYIPQRCVYYSTLQCLSSLLSISVSLTSLFWLVSVQFNSFVSIPWL